MFGIAVEFLLDKCFSAAFEEGDRKAAAEWPPNPVRLFRALTSAVHDSPLRERPDRFRDALLWLEAQHFPYVFAAPSLSRENETIGTFVPVNDTAAKPTGGFELSALRARKERRFPALCPASNRAFFLWLGAQPNEDHIVALAEILRFVGYLGSSRSLVSGWLCLEIPAGLDCWEPHENGRYRLRVAVPGALRDLETRATKFQETGLKAHRPGPGAWAGYRVTSETEAEPLTPNNYAELLPLELRTGLFTLEASQVLCSTWKRALIDKTAQVYGDLWAPAFLTGHTPGELGVPARQNHIVAVPLSHVGFQYADGRILGLGILMPSGLTPQQRVACFRAIQEIDRLQLGRFGVAEIVPVAFEDGRVALNMDLWSKPSRRWATTTPFVFHRFPKKPGDSESLVEQACGFAGLPKPRTVVVSSQAPLCGVPLSTQFKPKSEGDGRAQKFHRHLTLEFDQLVRGPLLLGAGQAYGYGFFRPIAKKA